MTNALLPVLLLLPMSVVTAAAGLGRLDDVAYAIQHVTLGSFVLVGVGYTLGCWFLAAFVQSQWHNIIRLLEGYPLRAIPAAYGYGTAVHQRRLREIQADQELQHLQHYRYPVDEAEFMPTTLGNTLQPQSDTRLTDTVPTPSSHGRGWRLLSRHRLLLKWTSFGRAWSFWPSYAFGVPRSLP